jgi:hypothetical protein
MVASTLSIIFHNVRPARSIVVAASSVHRAPSYTTRVDPDDLAFPELEPELDGEVPEPEVVFVDVSPDISVKRGKKKGWS